MNIVMFDNKSERKTGKKIYYMLSKNITTLYSKMLHHFQKIEILITSH